MSTLNNEGVTEKDLNSLSQNLKEMPESMRLFSLCFRSLYSDNAVGGHSEAAVKFRKIRDDTRQDAMVYLKCVLPATTNFIRSVKEYFGTYEALSYEEWYRMLPDILEDTKAHKDLAQMVLDLYENIMVPLKQREDDATTVMKEFEGLQSKYEEICKEYEATASSKRKWASALLFVPVVNMIACPLLGRAARENTALAVANKMDAEIHGGAAIIVSQTLIPALSNFINGLKKVAGFFQVLEQELKSFETKAGKDEPKRLHYKLMCYSARDINSLCCTFFQALPDVRTDFEALPVEDTDKNYVERWLEKTRAEIRSQSAFKSLVGAVSGSKDIDERKLRQPPPIPAPKPTQPRYKTQGIKLLGMDPPPKLSSKAPTKPPSNAPPKPPSNAPPKPPRSTTGSTDS
ncbi:uncharacterized protein LOC114523008 [Dendronephthya gigantea]|uniref:uncharacterized protein LOC114523008 n=1 Tax=Dendronephthya gigantea TaxID=151771 RepID=UPI00106A1BBA|nr:uncharacterized protein LOC114523008 [Dendronephthya gigantea]